MYFYILDGKVTKLLLGFSGSSRNGAFPEAIFSGFLLNAFNASTNLLLQKTKIALSSFPFSNQSSLT